VSVSFHSKVISTRLPIWLDGMLMEVGWSTIKRRQESPQGPQAWIHTFLLLMLERVAEAPQTILFIPDPLGR
jgi:hypothetical protein